MPGDYSRFTFKRENQYSGLLKQMGRVELDADDNEQLAIQHYRDQTEAIDVIGQSGVPKKNGGFSIGVASGGQNLTISAGRLYVDGLLCELDVATTYTSQPYLPNPEFVVANSPPTSQHVNIQPDGTYLVFLDAWKREITALNNDAIREVALGGPDTATRLQNVWQVRLIQVGNVGTANQPAITCKSPMPQFEQYTLAKTGKLNARTQPPPPEKSACLLPPGTGYNGLENQLYRVEVHTGGNENQATFKFSRDNGSVETTITHIAGNVLTVSSLGKDEILNFAPGQWVEIVDEESTLKAAPHPLVQIDMIGPGPNEVTLKTSAAALANAARPILRRWDQSGVIATASGISANLGLWIDLEDGIQVSFLAGSYRAGDYWLIPARTGTGQIEWPVDPNNLSTSQSPHGIRHHYSRLALVRSTAGVLTFVADCRKPFPPLTEICAVDVCFDNDTCDFDGAKTVQDALNMLCRRHEAGQCTFVVAPGDNVQAVFDAIPSGTDAEVCFQAGDYPLETTVNVEGKRHLKISGVGFGSHLRAPGAEAALKFLGCTSVLIRDIFAEAGIARAERNTPTKSLNGALTFLNCGSVNVESVGLRCASGTARAATCVTVRNVESTGYARVQHCVLGLGHQQTGILMVNVARSLVEDNVIRVDQATLRLNRLLEDRKYRAGVRSLLITDARLGSAPNKRVNSNVRLQSGDYVIQFLTDHSLRNAWTTLLQRNPATGINSPRALLSYVVKLADRLILDEAFRRRTKPFQAFLSRVFLQIPSVGSQGITVGGGDAAEVRVINNTIEGVLQGIHVGLSRRGDHARRASQVVTIAGNTISILLPPWAKKTDRHAIFVGNTDSLLIENNDARLTRLQGAEKLEIYGISVWGQLGNRVLVTQNHLASPDGNRDHSFNIGINVHPVNPWDVNTLWRVSFNVAPSRQRTVQLGPLVADETNIPLPIQP
ncbi:MAG: hypothetical protein JWM21_686 [Acidobacteria bacterium]|nr:hypothetical protein [Acidobacteriota bacterium]